MADSDEGRFEALLGWVQEHYPGGERQLLQDAGVNRRTLQRWRRQGAPERGSRALDAVDVAVRGALPAYPPAGFPGGGLPVLVGERAAGPASADPEVTAADPEVTTADPQDEAAPPVRWLGSRAARSAAVAWTLVAALTVTLVVLWTRADPEPVAGRVTGDPLEGIVTNQAGAGTAAAVQVIEATIDTSRPGQDPMVFISSYSRPAVQENCDGVICPGSSRQITIFFDGDPVNFTCQVKGQFVEAGVPAEPGWYGNSVWLKIVTPNVDRWVSNTWVLRQRLPDDVPTCQ